MAQARISRRLSRPALFLCVRPRMVLVRVVAESGDAPARVDVLGSYCIKDALKPLGYSWNPENKA